MAGPRQRRTTDLVHYAWLDVGRRSCCSTASSGRANSIKEFVFPRHEELYGYRFEGKQIELIDVEPPMTEQIIIGARPCDAAALPILDHVFNWDYARRVLQPPPRVDDGRHVGLPRARRPLLLHVGRLRARTIRAARTPC